MNTKQIVIISLGIAIIIAPWVGHPSQGIIDVLIGTALIVLGA